ncbi:hypothetical protein HHK36_029394 [Tetracentron sinense]|uniref:BHLH domain-containing protein n=1 Tax=Tetracentron sinense TaxID=13715 RepID=A0A834YF48_TETSI|nr:hypothetical protein HHK36_029394 [Tetracentron sinense]
MAAFCDQHPPFVHDSVFLSNTPIKMSDLLKEGNINTTSFSPFYPSEPLQEISFEPSIRESSCLDNSIEVPLTDHDEPTVTEKQNTDSSYMVVELETGDQVTQELTPMEKRDRHCLNSAQSKDAGEGKGNGKKQKKCNGTEEKKLKADKMNEMKLSEVAPTGYIHLRARRGQATDSHSLAERVRREKISEKMKLLQGLVPGCDKVTGKALILEEIINYVQSLQNQVEILSLKLASVNHMFSDFGMDLDSFMVKQEKLSSLASPLPSVQQPIPIHPTDFANTTTTFTTTNNYPLLDCSASILLQQGQRPNAFSQVLKEIDNGNLFWGVDDQRQKFINPTELNNLCSFQ